MIIKVCGLREADNIRAVEKTGADWMGFIFYPRSPRYVDARPDYLPEHATRVGVFVSPRFGEVMSRVREFGLNTVQLHGEATPEMCYKLRETGLRIIRALPANELLGEATHPYLGCTDYFLFDTPTPAHGGSGVSYDWSLLQHYTGHVPFLLSGGIGPQSLTALQSLSHPAWQGIDLNSRFETAPGVKDVAALQSFIEKIRNNE
ncbi:MAG: phosphoribosylanthranilate isomerase [Bacteroidales bacterium]|nr:phosphoribosylanthranilate isomerase [Bacteroidales bacterium]